MPDEILNYWLAQARDLAHRFNISEFETSSELWSWENFGEDISSLRNRLGVGDDVVDLLGLEVDLNTGITFDRIRNEQVRTNRVIPFLYYYTLAKDKGVADDWVKFGSLRGSWACRYSFDEKDALSLAEAFAENPNEMLDALNLIGGVESDYGEISFEISFLPKVKVLLILEEGDDEFPPDARLFYDRNSIFYLPHEMLGNISWFLTSRIFSIMSYLRNSSRNTADQE